MRNHEDTDWYYNPSKINSVIDNGCNHRRHHYHIQHIILHAARLQFKNALVMTFSAFLTTQNKPYIFLLSPKIRFVLRLVLTPKRVVYLQRVYRKRQHSVLNTI